MSCIYVVNEGFAHLSDVERLPQFYRHCPSLYGQSVPIPDAFLIARLKSPELSQPVRFDFESVPKFKASCEYVAKENGQKLMK